MSTESYFEATACEFISNHANQTSVIEVLGSSATDNITITSCQFETNIAIKNSLSLMYSNVVIKNSEFFDN